MTLQIEIEKARKDIRTDGYAVSVGEWISIYDRGELDIHPEFQRFFRWTPTQKSRLIESLLLGIPIPQIFVSQQPSGIWDVVDGLQRLSTIFEFVGVLRDENDERRPPLSLEPTEILQSLGGMLWEDPAQPDRSLTTSQKLLIKRAKIDAIIILAESAESAKYELFQRLNTGGSALAEQEVRNSIMVMLNKDRYRWLKDLSNFTAFRECVALSDRAYDEQYDMELVLRFIVFHRMPEAAMDSIGDLGEFLTKEARNIASDKAFDTDSASAAFRDTFTHLEAVVGGDAFRRWDSKRGRFVGGFSVSAFEAIALGLGYNAKLLTRPDAEMLTKIQQLWDNPAFTQNSGSGIRASSRIPKVVPLGRRTFAP
jgi:hypothetical protein